jgi:hypothetical protein
MGPLKGPSSISNSRRSKSEYTPQATTSNKPRSVFGAPPPAGHVPRLDKPAFSPRDSRRRSDQCRNEQMQRVVNCRWAYAPVSNEIAGKQLCAIRVPSGLLRSCEGIARFNSALARSSPDQRLRWHCRAYQSSVPHSPLEDERQTCNHRLPPISNANRMKRASLNVKGVHSATHHRNEVSDGQCIHSNV